MKKKWIIPSVALTATLTAALTTWSFSPSQASTTAATTAAKPQAVVIGSKGPVVGVNLYATHQYTAAATTTYAKRTLAYIKNTLHATAVDIVWNWYASSYTSNSVFGSRANTLTAGNVAIITKVAQKDGLYVEYRPIIFVKTKGDPWEGHIKPTNRTKWFNSYYSANLAYLKVAQKFKINEYVIGTEMTGVTPDPQWKSFLAKAAKVYKGEISFTADQYSFFPPAKLSIPPTKLTGVDMYMPMKLFASAPLSKVVATYESFWKKLPASLLRRTAIQETGIEARAGAYLKPSNLGAAGTLDQTVQYNDFIAGCDTVKKYHLRGIFFWKVDLADNPAAPTKALSVFEGRKGAVAIGKCESIVK